MTLSLVGTRLAAEGEEFVYRGESEGCEGCPYRKQCLNLEVGGRYKITDVRDGEILDCAVHEEGVIAVDVERATFAANVQKMGAYAGSKVSLAGTCPHTDCPSHDLCEPAGAEMDQEYRIVEDLGDVPHEVCHLDRSLTKVELAPVDQ